MGGRRPVAVSAPGKLILMGEHAAVYGRPALVAAIDLRLTARISPLPGTAVHLDLPGLGHLEDLSWEAVRAYARAARNTWTQYAEKPGAEAFRRVRGEDPAHVVKVALGEAAEELAGQAAGGLHVRIDSDLPIGSGFGSSAATAVAVIAATLSYFGASPDLARVERLALEVERRQHGQPSGVDGATVLHGGVIWARRRAPGGSKTGVETEPVATRSPLLSRLRVYDTGTPAEPTGAVVAAVRDRREREPDRFEGFLEQMEAATRDFRAVLESEVEDPDRSLHQIRAYEACLEEIGVVPEAVREAVRRVEAEGGAAKISGAGSLSGPGAGSLLVYHPDPKRIADWHFLRSFRFHPVHLGAPGFLLEEAIG
jgi:mevalonate kinase